MQALLVQSSSLGLPSTIATVVVAAFLASVALLVVAEVRDAYRRSRDTRLGTLRWLPVRRRVKPGRSSTARAA